MPEIPEMEIYKNYLNQWVKGKEIVEFYALRPKSLNLPVLNFSNQIVGQTIQRVDRKGKFLVLELNNRVFLLTHMMLDGRLYFLQAGTFAGLSLDGAEKLKEQIEGLPGKPSVIFKFSDDSLLFFCVLTFGYLHCIGPNELKNVVDKLGMDPLSSNFSALKFNSLLKGKKGMIKPWLMEQKNIAGIGNAYSNECLFAAGIFPTRQIASLSEQERESVFNSLISILNDSIRLGGDLEEPFAPWDKLTGGYIRHFKVYDRAGEPCKVCGKLIKKATVGGRNAFYCEVCQK